MGARFVPQRAGNRGSVRAPRDALAALIIPTEGVVEVVADGPSHTADRSTLVVVPAATPATFEAKSPVAHVLVLTVKRELGAHVVSIYQPEIDAPTLERALSIFDALPRTNWLNEICHRYLFERTVCKKRENDATRFLEAEIVKEIYFLRRERDAQRDRRSIVEVESSLVKRALQTIERSLFDGDVVSRLASSCGASSSTLLRAFKREVGETPLGYVRARRLDESLLLLKSKRFTVSEIATMVGYRNFAAFSHAFRARFGKRPSDVRSHRSR